VTIPCGLCRPGVTGRRRSEGRTAKSNQPLLGLGDGTRFALEPVPWTEDCLVLGHREVWQR
jgi:hypothetical protein